jgi:SAM-dependent methyltransferase
MAWFRRSSIPIARATVIAGREGDADVRLAYRLVLNREADQEGIRHYSRLMAQGLTFRGLIDALLTSAEYREREASPVPPASFPEPAINPADVVARHTVAELIETADEYYRSIVDPTPLMGRPFTYLHEAPVMLQSLGALLAGLQLGKTMTVLDFGAGACWLSRHLAQLNCQPICCDVSKAALDIGRRLFAKRPVHGATAFPPVFLEFDGQRLALEDESVDRIVCFDAFHHVPNVADVLGEFGRVLREGGIAGFSEPGREHSRSPQAQYEMRDHRVLENDVDLRAVFSAARGAGFTHLTVRAANDLEVSLEDYEAIVAGQPGDVQRAIWSNTCDTMRSRAVFFLHKGALRRDSRSHLGLAHTLSTRSTGREVPPGAPLTIDLEVSNTGQAAWLVKNACHIGIVRVATHLYDKDARLLALDHSRHDLPSAVQPGESIVMSIEVPLPADDDFVVGIDLVSEGVIWFEHVGSTPLMVRVRRRSD